MTAYSRRRLLALGGAITAGAVAGCSDSENTAGVESTPDGAGGSVLQSISLQNLTDTAQTIDVLARWGDTVEYWETHELDAIGGEDNSSLTLNSGWPTEPGEFQLTVRLSDDDTRAGVASTELPDHDCLDLVVLIPREGELSILTDVSGGECSDDSTGDTGSDT